MREIHKNHLRKRMVEGRNKSFLIITSEDVAEIVIENMKKNNYARYMIAGVVVIDKNMTGMKMAVWL